MVPVYVLLTSSQQRRRKLVQIATNAEHAFGAAYEAPRPQYEVFHLAANLGRDLEDTAALYGPNEEVC